MSRFAPVTVVRLAVAVTLAAIATVVAAAPQQATGFLDRTVVVEGIRYPYQVYVPASYESRSDWPVILFLHGAGERGNDGVGQTEVGIGSAIRRDPEMYPAVVVFPQVPDGARWPGAAGEAAVAALDATLAELNTDANRVALTGLSLGGNGSWYVGYKYAEKFAAVAPICGWVAAENSPDWVEAANGEEAIKMVAERLRDMPIWAFHGEVDGVVPVEGSRYIVEALKEVGSEVRYTELPGTGHNAWDSAYRSPEFATWLLAQRRQ